MITIQEEFYLSDFLENIKTSKDNEDSIRELISKAIIDSNKKNNFSFLKLIKDSIELDFNHFLDYFYEEMNKIEELKENTIMIPFWSYQNINTKEINMHLLSAPFLKNKSSAKIFNYFDLINTKNTLYISDLIKQKNLQKDIIDSNFPLDFYCLIIDKKDFCNQGFLQFKNLQKRLKNGFKTLDPINLNVLNFKSTLTDIYERNKLEFYLSDTINKYSLDKLFITIEVFSKHIDVLFFDFEKSEYPLEIINVSSESYEDLLFKMDYLDNYLKNKNVSSNIIKGS